MVSWPFRQFTAFTLVAAGTLVGVSSASAEIVFLKTGRSLSVKAVRYDGDTATLAMRAGGEITCDRSAIDRVEPDEVPYPEPVAEAVPGAGAAAIEARAVAPAAGRLTEPPPIPKEFSALVHELSTRHGVDARIVHAVITVESAYQHRARSPKGAKGLMQLMPGTARQYGVRNAYNPAANLDAGIKHLRSLMDRFDLTLALAAYNAGEAAVKRFGGIPPYRETREYVTRVLQLVSPREVLSTAARR